MSVFDSIFNWIQDKVEAVIEKVEEAAGWVQDKVDDVIDFFTRLGSSGPYSGSVQETVTIDKVLNNFRAKLSPDAEKLEQDSIASVLAEFDNFIKDTECDYPELVSALKKKKESVVDHLNGIIIDHINKRASINDKEFEAILEMQPGAPKTRALNKQAQKFLLEAEALFKEKLQKEMDELNAELSERFNEELKSQKAQLEQKETAYWQLLDDADRGQLDLKGLEEDCILIADSYSCMDYLFAQMENEK